MRAAHITMKPQWAILLLLLLSSLRGACNGVSVIRVSDGKVVAKDSPGPLAIYRDMLLSVDDVGGRVAIIQWGRQRSTIKILGLDGKNAKHSVAIGRENGIDGAEYYDFSSNNYIFHDNKGLHFFGKKSKPREVSNPLPRDYRTSTIVHCKDGLLISAIYCAGDYRGAIIYRYCQSQNSIKKLYETSEGMRAQASEGDCAIIVEDVRDDYKSRHIVRVAFDGQVLSRVRTPIHLSEDSNHVKIEKDGLYEAYGGNSLRLQQTKLDDGTVLRTLEFADIPGGVELFDVEDNIAVIRATQAPSDGSSMATVVDIGTKKVLMRFKCRWSVEGLMLLKHNGEVYCIVAN
jgi:hypothetical protein